MYHISKKEEKSTKAIYLKNSTIKAIDNLAIKNNTSFSYIVQTLLDQCLENLN